MISSGSLRKCCRKGCAGGATLLFLEAGSYDAALVDAVKHFQLRHGLDANGSVARKRCGHSMCQLRCGSSSSKLRSNVCSAWISSLPRSGQGCFLRVPKVQAHARRATTAPSPDRASLPRLHVPGESSEAARNR